MDASAPADTLSERWAALGRSDGSAAVALDSVGLWTVELPFRAPVRTARGAHRTRPIVLVHLVGRAIDAAGDGVGVEGWGECAALADATFDAEDVERSLAVLRHVMVPALVERSADERPPRSSAYLLPAPSDLEEIRRASPHAPLAFAALEMAVADTHLRAAEQSLAGLLGVAGRRVEIGAVVGQTDTTDQLVAMVGALVDQGYRRVKLKIGPRWDVEPVAQVRAAFPDLLLQVDANGAYGTDDEWTRIDRSAVSGLTELDGFGLLCIEQPFDRSDLTSHAELARAMTTPICLDESLDSPRSVDEALSVGACSVVCVKPSRLGGVGAALEVIDRCGDGGVPLWMGGMFESGYARGVITTLGALDGMAWPGDLAPTRSYLEDDLVPELALARVPRSGGPGALVADLPRGTGMGPAPEADALARLGAKHQFIGGLGG
jgi:O-succinylbenzoate synthase